MSKIPKLTVLMPMFNSEMYLQDVMASILSQTFTDFEFLIIDDGSNDSSVEIVNRFNDSRIHLHRRNHFGFGAQLNYGLDCALAPIIARMDADDIAYPTRFEKQYQFLVDQPDVGIVGTWYERIDENNNILGINKLPCTSKGLKALQPIFCPFLHPSVMFRKNIVINAGGYNAELVPAEDFELWLRLSELTEFATIPTILMQKRNHANNVSFISSQAQEKKIFALSYEYAQKKLEMSTDNEEITRSKILLAKVHYYHGSMNDARNILRHIVIEHKANLEAWRFFIPSLFGNSLFQIIRRTGIASWFTNGCRMWSQSGKYFSP